MFLGSLNSISNFTRSRKARDLLGVALIVLTGTASFGLGRLSVLYENRPEVTVTMPDGSVVRKMPGHITSQHIENGNIAGAKAALAEEGTVVASKNGSVYHLPWCSGAQRIKEENKIWFDSPAAARGAGLRAAANCPGLE